MREYFLWLSETAFWVTGGVPLTNGLEIIVWVLFGLILMYIVLVQAVDRAQRGQWSALLLLPVILGLFFTIIGVPLTQLYMLKECEQHTVTVTVEDSSRDIRVNRCRHLSNFYDTEYSDWNLFLN